MITRWLTLLLLALVMLACELHEVNRPAPDDSEEEESCEIGRPQELCYTGPPETRNVGICHEGVILCGSNVCFNERHPLPNDLCNGLDDDCDGEVDEDVYLDVKCHTCVPEASIGMDIHYGGDSTCRWGCAVCISGVEYCHGWIGPRPETCDGLDNDCDGRIDEDLTLRDACGYENRGWCAYGDYYCIDSDLICVGAVEPVPEICDDVDNDCDGRVDEDDTLTGRLERECATDCGIGIEYCEWGEWVGCTARRTTTEVCNNFDDDCDGLIDEGLACECNDGDEQECPSIECAPEDEQPCVPCGWGIQVCEDGRWSTCEGQIIRSREQCNSVDDDCNGEIDEGFLEECYTGDPETDGVGTCSPGWLDCVGGQLTGCLEQSLPRTETCNGLDDDCDGDVDEVRNAGQLIDLLFLIDYSGSMQTCVEQMIPALVSVVNSIEGEDHRAGIVLFGGSSTRDEEDPFLALQLTSIPELIEFLGTLTHFDGSREPSIDALREAANPLGGLGSTIAWRNFATPVLILVTDERPQVSGGAGANTSNVIGLEMTLNPCRLPGCNTITNRFWEDELDPAEVFIFGNALHYEIWVSALSDREDRFFSITDNFVGGGCIFDFTLDLTAVFERICLLN